MLTYPAKISRFASKFAQCEVPFVVLLAILVAIIAGPALAKDDGDLGKKIYDQHCVSCHGDKGQGGEDEFGTALDGDKTLPRLVRYIEKWMPEEEPEQVVGEDAQHVARYMYDAFYSPIAQARHRPARIELTRLTADQYRQAVADLIGSFRPGFEPGNERGLRAEYFNARKPGSKRVVERTEDQLRLRFEKPSEVAEPLDKVGFSARWEGSLIAPETGTYDIILETDHGARIWLNDSDTPLIDRWVVSGDETTHRASIFLVGGRAYPLKVEFTSRNQGVKKEEKDPKPVAGFIELRWKQPKHVAEVVPNRYLLPKRAPEVFVTQTAFPPDDRSVGYERGTSISEAWQRATTDAAIEAAAYVTERLPELAGKKQDEPALRKFAQTIVERAFRRPVSQEVRNIYLDRQFDTAPDLPTAVKRVVLLALTSPRFLYLDFGKGNPDSYDIASRLSFVMWNSLPDESLRKAAAEGKLTSPDVVGEHARRMVDDLRTRAKLRQFFHHWLQLDHQAELAKSAEVYPDFNDAIASDLRTSLDLFIDQVVWSDTPDYRRLLNSNELYLNGRLAQYYGYDLPADAPFQKVKARRPERRGVLAHPYVMAVFAYTDTTSPIHRGVLLARGVLGRTLRPPPEAFAPLAADLHPDLTTRQRVAKQTEPRSCMTCHSMINPLGFTLEQFDAVGRFREKENGKPIDPSGQYELPSGEVVEFKDPRDLANFIVSSSEAHEGFVLQLFHDMVKQPIRGYGQDTPAQMGKAFADDQKFNLHELMASIATTAALHGHDQPKPAKAEPKAPADKQPIARK